MKGTQTYPITDLFIIFLLLIPTMYAIYYLFSQRKFYKYSLIDNSLSIKSIFNGTYEIGIDEIKSIKSINYVEFLINFFPSPRKFVLVETIFSNIVYIRTESSSYYLSPPNIDSFISTVRNGINKRV